MFLVLSLSHVHVHAVSCCRKMALSLHHVSRPPGRRTSAQAPASPVSRPLHTRISRSSSLSAFESDLSGVEREVPRLVAASALRPSSEAARLLETLVQQQVPQNGLLDAVPQKGALSNSLMENVQQQVTHDSLLRNGAASFWSYLDSVRCPCVLLSLRKFKPSLYSL
jgi:hypothetical protein